jgi:aconitate hydratase
MGAKTDMNTANESNKEVYDFLSSVSANFGIGFWKPGAGIIHQVVLENYAFPGGMMVGTDSHTPMPEDLVWLLLEWVEPTL